MRKHEVVNSPNFSRYVFFKLPTETASPGGISASVQCSNLKILTTGKIRSFIKL